MKTRSLLCPPPCLWGSSPWLQWLWKWTLSWSRLSSYSYGARAVIFSPWSETPGGLWRSSGGILKLTKRTTISRWLTSIFWAYAPSWKSYRGLWLIKPQVEIHSPAASWQKFHSPPFFWCFQLSGVLVTYFSPSLGAGKTKSTKSFWTLTSRNRRARRFPRPGSAAWLTLFAGWNVTHWLV